jgi:hypothetical protein
MIHPYCHCPFVIVQISPDAVKTSSADKAIAGALVVYRTLSRFE